MRTRREGGKGRRWCCGHSRAHGLLQAVDVLAAAVDAVVLVGGGAGVLRGDQGGRVPAGEERVLRVEGSGAPSGGSAPLFSFALLFLPRLRGVGIWSDCEGDRRSEPVVSFSSRPADRLCSHLERGRSHSAPRPFPACRRRPVNSGGRRRRRSPESPGPRRLRLAERKHRILER